MLPLKLALSPTSLLTNLGETSICPQSYGRLREREARNYNHCVFKVSKVKVLTRPPIARYIGVLISVLHH